MINIDDKIVRTEYIGGSIYKFDKDDRLIYFKYLDCHELWREYDEKGCIEYLINNNGTNELWFRYDKDGILTHYKKSKDDEWILCQDSNYYLKRDDKTFLDNLSTI